MALPILDGNQSATTLSTILSSGQHIPAHTVVSLGTQAITDMRSAVSGSVVSISNLPSTQTIAGTVTAFGEDTVSGGFLPIPLNDGGEAVLVDIKGAFGSGVNVPISGTVTVGNTVTIAGTVTANPTGTQTIAGTVTANLGEVSSIGGGEPPTKAVAIGFEQTDGGIFRAVDSSWPLPISGTVTIGSALPAGTNRIGVVTIGAGTVTIGAGTSQIGSVTASISNSVTIGNTVTISGTVNAGLASENDFVTIGEEIAQGINNQGTIPISGTVTANTFAVQGTAVTTSNFTSTTASTVLANFNATREVLTIFNEGAGNLHICAGATCTTIAYQVRLSAGDYYEVPNHQTTITHSAVFATAGTARVTQVS